MGCCRSSPSILRLPICHVLICGWFLLSQVAELDPCNIYSSRRLRGVLACLCQVNARPTLLGWPSLINTELQEFCWNGSCSFCGNQCSIYGTLVTLSRSPFFVCGWCLNRTDCRCPRTLGISISHEDASEATSYSEKQ